MLHVLDALVDELVVDLVWTSQRVASQQTWPVWNVMALDELRGGVGDVDVFEDDGGTLAAEFQLSPA